MCFAWGVVGVVMVMYDVWGSGGDQVAIVGFDDGFFFVFVTTVVVTDWIYCTSRVDADTLTRSECIIVIIYG